MVEREGTHDEIDGTIQQGKTLDVALLEGDAVSQTLAR
jgi:hypothetical protein